MTALPFQGGVINDGSALIGPVDEHPDSLPDTFPECGAEGKTLYSCVDSEALVAEDVGHIALEQQLSLRGGGPSFSRRPHSSPGLAW